MHNPFQSRKILKPDVPPRRINYRFGPFDTRRVMITALALGCAVLVMAALFIVH